MINRMTRYAATLFLFIVVSGNLVLSQIPTTSNLSPHFESVGGRKVFFVDGKPFVSLAVEIPWRKLIYGQYKETLHRYDYLYPAAEAMRLNTLKVPVKWSVVEPERGIFDFSYVDHAKAMAEKHNLKLVLGWFGHYASGDGTIYRNLTSEVFAPMDIIEDIKTYPRAVDAEGTAHHNAVSYEYEPIIQREIAAFTAFMKHLRKVDSETRTVIMVQVENEIAVFGSDRQNPSLWRDHSERANEVFESGDYSDDLQFSTERFSKRWIGPLTRAGAEIYSLPFFLNFVGGKVADWMIGGAPGEHVPSYLENCPEIDFVGLNLYTSPESSTNDLRAALERYRIGRNLPSITETNSGDDPVAPRLAYLSIGEFGSPIFAPWALNTSYPSSFEPYVLEDGTLANGAFALRDAYTSLRQALPLVATFGGSRQLKVFMATRPGEVFSQWYELGDRRVTVSGEKNGQAIVINTGPGEYYVIGYRCRFSLGSEEFAWPAIKSLRVERGRFDGVEWMGEDAEVYTVNQSSRTVSIGLSNPSVVRVSW